MMAKAKTEKPEKPTPVACVCGRGGIVVKTRAGKMITCPAPTVCQANLRTRWHSNEEAAIIEWNRLVAGYRRGGK